MYLFSATSATYINQSRLADERTCVFAAFYLPSTVQDLVSCVIKLLLKMKNRYSLDSTVVLNRSYFFKDSDGSRSSDSGNLTIG